MRPRCKAMVGVSGNSRPCWTYSSRISCFADGLRLSVSKTTCTGRESLTIYTAHAGAELKHQGGARSTECVCRSFERIMRRSRRAHHFMKHSSCADLALQGRAFECGLEIRCSEFV